MPASISSQETAIAAVHALRAELIERQTNSQSFFNGVLQRLDEIEEAVTGGRRDSDTSHDDEASASVDMSQPETDTITTATTTAPESTATATASTATTNPTTTTPAGTIPATGAVAVMHQFPTPANLTQSANTAAVTQNATPNNQGFPALVPAPTTTATGTAAATHQFTTPANLTQSANTAAVIQNATPNAQGLPALVPAPVPTNSSRVPVQHVANYALPPNTPMKYQNKYHISNYNFETIVSNDGIRTGDEIRIPIGSYRHNGVRHNLQGAIATMIYSREPQHRVYEFRVLLPALPGAPPQSMVVRGTGPNEWFNEMKDVGYIVHAQSTVSSQCQIYRNNFARGTINEVKWAAKIGNLLD